MDDAEEGGKQKCKCPPCPAGAPKWMVTFSDLVTLLLTFFVLLLSFAKTETAKYEAALGSVRNAFGGAVLKQGEVIQKGKSPDDYPTMIESQQPIKPFPIEFLTMEGILDKHEINRASEEVLKFMKRDLSDFELSENVDIYEMPEGIKVRVKEVIFFKEGSIEIEKVSVEVFEKIVKMMTVRDWMLFVEGHAEKGESSIDNKMDALLLSSSRATAVTRNLIKRGIMPTKISTVFYGDSRPHKIEGGEGASFDGNNRRVEFMLRKVDLRADGHKVDSR